MAKFLIQASYSREGLRGVKEEGAASRVAALEATLHSIGGRVESFYFALGESDVYLTADLPDTSSALALGVAVASTNGIENYKTIVLLTAEETDMALKTAVNYRSPGA